MEWSGVKGADKLLDAAQAVEPTPLSSVLWVYEATNRRPLDSLRQCGHAIPDFQPSDIHDVFESAFSVRTRDLPVTAVFHIDNLIKELCGKTGVSNRAVYARLLSDVKIDMTAVKKHLAKRPWNASLKTLCWKLGESFVKFSNHKDDFYGHLYTKRKEYEMGNNASGKLSDQAAAILTKKRIGKTTDAYAAYSTGHLPPAHIHSRAKRWTVKLFLASYHEVAYWLHYQQLPPKPYVIEHLGHVHYIGPPNLEMVPGLKEAKERAGRQAT